MTVTLYLSPWLLSEPLKSNANHSKRWIKWIGQRICVVNSTRSIVSFGQRESEIDRQSLKSGKTKPFLIVGIGSSAREFMCNAQVKRMSKRKKESFRKPDIAFVFIWGLIFNVFFSYGGGFIFYCLSLINAERISVKREKFQNSKSKWFASGSAFVTQTHKKRTSQMHKKNRL